MCCTNRHHQRTSQTAASEPVATQTLKPCPDTTGRASQRRCAPRVKPTGLHGPAGRGEPCPYEAEPLAGRTNPARTQIATSAGRRCKEKAGGVKPHPQRREPIGGRQDEIPPLRKWRRQRAADAKESGRRKAVATKAAAEKPQIRRKRDSALQRREPVEKKRTFKSGRRTLRQFTQGEKPHIHGMQRRA